MCIMCKCVRAAGVGGTKMFFLNRWKTPDSAATIHLYMLPNPSH